MKRMSIVIVLSVASAGACIAQGHRSVFPEVIQLPAGFGPEGIASGNGSTLTLDVRDDPRGYREGEL